MPLSSSVAIALATVPFRADGRRIENDAWANRHEMQIDGPPRSLCSKRGARKWTI